MAMMKTSLIVLTALLLSSATALSRREGKFLLDLFNVVRLNPVSRGLVGILLTFPISVFAPDYFLWDKDERALGGRQSWPFEPSRSTFPKCPSRVAPIEDYLSMLRIYHVPCQELFICEVAKNPQRFMPISKVLLKKLDVITISPDTSNTTEFSLFEAYQVGMDALQECRKSYSECPVDATSLVNMKLLEGWQFVSRFVKLKFVAETDANLRNY